MEGAKKRHAFEDLFQREDAGVEAVVEIGGGVGDLVGQIDELGFEGRELVEEELGQLRMGGLRVVVGVLDDALAHAEGQVQSTKAGVAFFKPCDDAQGVQIVVKAEAKATQAFVKSLFAGVAKGRMADVVGKGQRLGQILVQPEGAGESAGDLGDFQCMGQAASEVVRQGIAGQPCEDLRLAGQPSEGAGVQNARAVAGKGSAVGMGRLGVGATSQFVVCGDGNACW